MIFDGSSLDHLAALFGDTPLAYTSRARHKQGSLKIARGRGGGVVIIIRLATNASTECRSPRTSKPNFTGYPTPRRSPGASLFLRHGCYQSRLRVERGIPTRNRSTLESRTTYGEIRWRFGFDPTRVSLSRRFVTGRDTETNSPTTRSRPVFGRPCKNRHLKPGDYGDATTGVW